MLKFLDIFLSIVHLSVIGFNITGWIWTKTRKLHFLTIIATAGSWFVLGIWFGIGYCPITDWQWQVKEKRGEQNLPGSFVKYFADKVTGTNFKPSTVDIVTVTVFAIAAILSVYVNFFRKSKAPK